MFHKESSTKIYYTSDYSVFKWIAGNRDIDLNKVRRIQTQISEGLDILRYCPILVQERVEDGKVYLYIIEGQHRFFVAEKIKSKVWYVLVEDIAADKIADINANSSGWKNNDYLNFHTAQANQNYITLQAFLREHSISFSSSLRLLQTGTAIAGGLHSNVLHDFKKGKFKVNHLEKAVGFMKCLTLFSTFKNYKSGLFVTAIYKIIEANKIDIHALAEKFKTKKFAQEQSVADYLEELENIASEGQRQRVAIY